MTKQCQCRQHWIHVCVRETEAVIVKHQLIVQLLLKDVREREEGNQEERNQSAQKTERASPHNCAENNCKKLKFEVTKEG